MNGIDEEKKTKPKRANKNAPQELSSTRRPKKQHFVAEKREVRGRRERNGVT